MEGNVEQDRIRWKEKLQLRVRELSDARPEKTRRLCREIRRNFAVLREYYRELLCYTRLSEGDSAFSGDFPRMAEAVRNILGVLKEKYLPVSQGERLPDLYLVFQELLEIPGPVVEEPLLLEVISTMEEKRALVNEEHALMLPLLQAAALSGIAEIVSEKTLRAGCGRTAPAGRTPLFCRDENPSSSTFGKY